MAKQGVRLTSTTWASPPRTWQPNLALTATSRRIAGTVFACLSDVVGQYPFAICFLPSLLGRKPARCRDVPQDQRRMLLRQHLRRRRQTLRRPDRSC